jgi:hypothetical protein
MINACSFVQANYIGGLASPNDKGVCFSLSIAWLAEKKDAGYISALKSTKAIEAIYKNAKDKRTITQASANACGANRVTTPPSAVMDVVKKQYGNIGAVHGIPLAPKTFAVDAKELSGAPESSVFIWMVKSGAGGRGHVVGWRPSLHLFFDANFGVYANATAADVAKHLNANYTAQYNVYFVISFAA